MAGNVGEAVELATYGPTIDFIVFFQIFPMVDGEFIAVVQFLGCIMFIHHSFLKLDPRRQSASEEARRRLRVSLFEDSLLKEFLRFVLEVEVHADFTADSHMVVEVSEAAMTAGIQMHLSTKNMVPEIQEEDSGGL